jgi:hypothetical protein
MGKEDPVQRDAFSSGIRLNKEQNTRENGSKQEEAPEILPISPF